MSGLLVSKMATCPLDKPRPGPEMMKLWIEFGISCLRTEQLAKMSGLSLRSSVQRVLTEDFGMKRVAGPQVCFSCSG